MVFFLDAMPTIVYRGPNLLLNENSKKNHSHIFLNLTSQVQNVIIVASIAFLSKFLILKNCRVICGSEIVVLYILTLSPSVATCCLIMVIYHSWEVDISPIYKSHLNFISCPPFM